MKPEGPVARRSEYSVRDAPFAEASALIRAEHYSAGSANTAVYCHGLYRGTSLVGAALWMPPTKLCALTVHKNWKRVLSLSRLAIKSTEPTNAESLLIGASIRKIRRDRKWVALVTYADCRMGHAGTIYRATNWVDRGLTKPQPCWVDAAGRQVARKATRTRTKAEMLALGFRYLGSFPKRKFTLVLGEQ